MRSDGIAPSDILNFAITRDRLSAREHAPPDFRRNLGANQNRLRVQNPTARDRAQHEGL